MFKTACRRKAHAFASQQLGTRELSRRWGDLLFSGLFSFASISSRRFSAHSVCFSFFISSILPPSQEPETCHGLSHTQKQKSKAPNGPNGVQRKMAILLFILNTITLRTSAPPSPRSPSTPFTPPRQQPLSFLGRGPDEGEIHRDGLVE